MIVAWQVKPHFEYDVYTAAGNDGVLEKQTTDVIKAGPGGF